MAPHREGVVNMIPYSTQLWFAIIAAPLLSSPSCSWVFDKLRRIVQGCRGDIARGFPYMGSWARVRALSVRLTTAA
jgi:hypothetical protein